MSQFKVKPAASSAFATQRHPAELWRREFLYIGHRGAAKLAPENTLSGFRVAVEHAVDAVELDLHYHEGELLVIHDDTLERTTNGHGTLVSHSLQQLRSLDAGHGNRIPLLAEVLALLPSRIGINLELKGPATAAPTARLLAELCPANPILVSSFDHGELRDYRARDSDTALAPLFHKYSRHMLRTAAELGAITINLAQRIATPSVLNEIRAAGYGALVYTVNDLPSLRRLVLDGATGVFTDRPDHICLTANSQD
jgi:glycerophosphoryl diester phosphodiesterase